MKSPWKGRLLLLGIAVVLAVGLGEVGLRLLSPVEHRDPTPPVLEEGWADLIHQPSQIEGLAYELVPGVERRGRGSLIRTNSLGMRDIEPKDADTPGLVRIAAIGDSFTFGLGVAGKDAYPNVLQKMLNDQRRGSTPVFDVLNLAVSGYNTRDEALVVRHKALPLEPRMILVGYYLNDPETEAMSPLQVYFFETQWWQHLHLTRLIHREWFTRQAMELGDGDYLRFLHHEPGRWQSVLDGFADIAAAAGELDIPVLVVVFPDTPEQGWSLYPYGDLHQKVAQAARDAGLGVLDLWPVFREFAPLQLMVRPGDSHPSVRGHQIAAAAILETIQRDHPEVLQAGDS